MAGPQPQGTYIHLYVWTARSFVRIAPATPATSPTAVTVKTQNADIANSIAFLLRKKEPREMGQMMTGGRYSLGSSKHTVC